MEETIPIYPCNQCNHRATCKGNLKIHIRAIHEGVKFPCNYCGYRTTQKESLQKHLRAIHEGQEKAHMFPCTQVHCNTKEQFKINSTNAAVKLHSLWRIPPKSIHEGVKFPGNECDYKVT